MRARSLSTSSPVLDGERASARHALSLWAVLTALLTLTGCPPDSELPQQPDRPGVDQGRDMRPEQDMRDLGDQRPDMHAQPDQDLSPDLPQDMRVDPPDMAPDMRPPDMGQPPRAYPKPVQVTPGTTPGRLLLQGAVLTPRGPLDPGEVLIVDDKIVCADVLCNALPEAAGATVVQTHGIISPGLIDAHNHLAYNFLPEWVAPNNRLFGNRYQWADDPSYEAHVRPLTKYRSTNSHFCPAARWGELRSLLHGTTTIQGQSFNRVCTQGGVRNADHAHGLQYNHMRTDIGSPRDITDSGAASLITSFRAMPNPVTRFAVHMAEGYEGNNITLEFSSFAGRDTRANRHQGISLLEDQTAVLIHAIALTREELVEAKMTNSRIVWSPSSNMALYGRTADIKTILELGIRTGLGPDWTISGEDDMLAELRYAYDWALRQGIMLLTPRKLWEMATVDGAAVVGLEAFIGELAVGMVADVTVFARRDEPSDLYEQVITSYPEDVRLVLIGGQAYYGDLALKSALERRPDCEPFDACGSQKFVCVKHDNADTYASVSMLQTLLYNILEGVGYPADEQYGRGAELLPLVQCAPR